MYDAVQVSTLAVEKAFVELIDLIILHLTQDIQMSRSMKTIRKHIDKMFEDVAVQKHHYCGWCTKLLGDDDTCSNLACAGHSMQSFLQIPLVPQLQRRLQGKQHHYFINNYYIVFILKNTLPVFIDPKLWSAIQQRHTSNGDGIKEIYDRKICTRLFVAREDFCLKVIQPSYH